MQEFGLGPNGAMLYCLEYLEKNVDWLVERLETLEQKYLIFDFPGQVGGARLCRDYSTQSKSQSSACLFSWVGIQPLRRRFHMVVTTRIALDKGLGDDCHNNWDTRLYCLYYCCIILVKTFSFGRRNARQWFSPCFVLVRRDARSTDDNNDNRYRE